MRSNIKAWGTFPFNYSNNAGFSSESDNISIIVIDDIPIALYFEVIRSKA